MAVSIEAVFLKEMLCDCILITTAVSIQKKKLHAGRMLCGGAAAAAVSCAVRVCSWNSAVRTVFVIVFPFIMLWAALDSEDIKEVVKGGVVFLLEACTAGGIFTMAGISGLAVIPVLILSCAGMVKARRYEEAEKQKSMSVCSVSLKWMEHSIRLTGLADSGNNLRTCWGKPVHILGKSGWEQLLSESDKKYVEAFSEGKADCTAGNLSLFFLKFCDAEGCSHLIAGMSMDELEIQMPDGKAVAINRPAVGLLMNDISDTGIILNPSDML